MSATYPILLDVSDRLAVIIGGGAVAARKASGLLETGCRRVRVVAEQVRGDFPPVVQVVEEPYRASHLEGAGLVFAATDSPEVNDTVVRDARARGILVCRADVEPDLPGDFTVPARLHKGPVVVSVSAGSAALAASIRDGLAARWDPAWTRMAEAMKVLRPKVKGEHRLSVRQRREVFRDLAGAEAIDVLGSRGLDELWKWLVQRHPELAAPVPGSAPERGDPGTLQTSRA